MLRDLVLSKLPGFSSSIVILLRSWYKRRFISLVGSPSGTHVRLKRAKGLSDYSITNRPLTYISLSFGPFVDQHQVPGRYT